jgi:hypothetical protein
MTVNPKFWYRQPLGRLMSSPVDQPLAWLSPEAAKPLPKSRVALWYFIPRILRSID